jgi:hypothetical protein
MGTSGKNTNHCAANPGAWTGAWQQLEFEIDEDSLFYYGYTGAAQSFTATATGDLDCDGLEVTYTMIGAAVNGNPTATLSEPPPNSD